MLTLVPVFLPVLVFEGLFDTLSLKWDEIIDDVEECLESSQFIQSFLSF